MDTQSRNLTIPRGKVLFAKFKPGTQVPGPYRELGNCPEFTLTRDSELFPHYSSQAGLRVKDEEIIIEASLNGTVTTDDIKLENIEYWFMGKTVDQTTVAETGVAFTAADIAAGDVYQLGRTDENPGGFRNVENVVLNLSGTPGTPLVLGDDYTIDLPLGIVQFLDGGAAVGKSVEGTFDTIGETRKIVISQDEQIEGELKFVAMNHMGPQNDVVIPRARISPNGDFALVNDPESTAWQTMPLSISGLKKNNMPLAIVEGRPF